MEAVALRGPWRVCMIATEIPNTFLESPDIVLSLIPDPNWYLKVDQISPTLPNTDFEIKHCACALPLAKKLILKLQFQKVR